MITKPNYTRIPIHDQTRLVASQLKTRRRVLAQGCRRAANCRRVVYLATTIDQYRHADYRQVRGAVAARFRSREWMIFEPARCNWTSADWLRVWPRLLCWIDALVIWPRPDGGVGYGVFQEAQDIQRLGRPVYVIAPHGSLRALGGFTSFKKTSLVRYAGVRAGKAISPGRLPEGGR